MSIEPSRKLIKMLLNSFIYVLLNLSITKKVENKTHEYLLVVLPWLRDTEGRQALGCSSIKSNCYFYPV